MLSSWKEIEIVSGLLYTIKIVWVGWYDKNATINNIIFRSNSKCKFYEKLKWKNTGAHISTTAEIVVVIVET